MIDDADVSYRRATRTHNPIRHGQCTTVLDMRHESHIHRLFHRVPDLRFVATITIGISAIFWTLGCGPIDESIEHTGNVSSAERAYDHCNAVLEGDLFNKTSLNQNYADKARVLIWNKLLSLDEDTAYDSYSKAYEETRRSGGNAGIKILGFSFGGGGGTERKLTQQEFKQVYRHMKKQNESTNYFDWNRDTSLMSVYNSYIRDANSIEAWQACVTAAPATNLYAYGRRDESGATYVHVMWVPGLIDHEVSTVTVSFEYPAGASVSQNPVQIGKGSGKTLRISNAPETGFDVYANSDVLSGRYSFTSVAIIPPKQIPTIKLPDACEQKRLQAFLAGQITDAQLELLRQLGRCEEAAPTPTPVLRHPPRYFPREPRYFLEPIVDGDRDFPRRRTELP